MAFHSATSAQANLRSIAYHGPVSAGAKLVEPPRDGLADGHDPRGHVLRGAYRTHPGHTQMPHLLENLGAAAVRFTPSALAELNSAASSIQIQGARLPESVLVLSESEATKK